MLQSVTWIQLFKNTGYICIGGKTLKNIVKLSQSIFFQLRIKLFIVTIHFLNEGMMGTFILLFVLYFCVIFKFSTLSKFKKIFKSSSEYMFIDFLEREEGGEREREIKKQY